MEKKEKIILVTGSTGFLGSAITQRLLVFGCKLRLLIRKKIPILLKPHLVGKFD